MNARTALAAVEAAYVGLKADLQSAQDLPDGAAVGEAVEAFVELIERDALAEQAIDRQAPGPVQLDVARDVACRIAAADDNCP